MSIVLAMIPVFGVLYWFAAQHGSWHLVFVVHLAVSAAAIAVLLRQLTVYTAVTASELVGRGIFSPLERVPLERIASVVIVSTYVGQSLDAEQQLLVRDASGRRLFRMRGSFWPPGALVAVADSLPGEPVILREPISFRTFFTTYPGSAYWFENKPMLWIAVGVLMVGLAVAIAAWVMTILGMPVALLPA
ncbi:MAG TPA: hypothetical protein VGM70_12050 [Pseudolysinimonas sp.]